MEVKDFFQGQNFGLVTCINEQLKVRALGQHFYPGGWEFEKANLQLKEKSSNAQGAGRGGGGGWSGTLKF